MLLCLVKVHSDKTVVLICTRKHELVFGNLGIL